ncbi:MAG: tetratricopeptide repeat protein [Verrucomicrobiae bacterium]|nr:tetratricopeptide repeat protein [Verrucomicrobiae bacterium]NNJ43380.1 tetratricopeptide repeat protein [Akkermansiaceae bacterium]
MRTLFVTSLPLFVFSMWLHAAEPIALSQDYWKDESFLKSFNGSYRVNARIEPTVNSEERGLLVSIQSLMAAGKREQALAKLKASPMLQSSAAIAYNAGNIQFELGALKEAAKHYQDALKIFPSFRRAHRNLGFVFARENDWDQALPSLEEAIRLGDQDGSTYGQLAYGRMHKEQYASSLQAYRLAQLTQPESVDWKVGTAQCLQYLQRNDEALALLDEVLASRPNESSYYLLQASIQLSMDRTDDAIINLELVRRLGMLDAGNHLLLASLHLRAGSRRLARPVMMSALAMEAKPTVPAALNVLEFSTQIREWELARDFSLAFEKSFPAVKDEKLKQKHQRLVALIDIDSGENPSRGAAVLQALIKNDPLDASSLILLARHHARQTQHQQSEMLLQQAARVEGFEYEASIELAKLYVTMARYRAAVKQLDRALDIRSSTAIETYREAVIYLAEASE